MPNNEFGDFQTPVALANQCLKVLNLPKNARIFEPTCGWGAFLEAAQALAPESERYGLEINPDYAHQASKWGNIMVDNVFKVSFPEILDWKTDGSLFIIGNPPWVTSAELKRMGSANLPEKDNFKNVKGLEALLGASNFDVCEYIILKALSEFSQKSFVLGMLCKTQVARNVLEYAASYKIPLINAAIYRIDAKRWFNAGVDACWFTLEVNNSSSPNYIAEIYENLFMLEEKPSGCFGVVDSLLVSDIDKYFSVRQADGKSPYVWRSGLKHDASNVFELKATPEPMTKSGEFVDLEPEYIFPFLKSTDVFRGRHRELSKWVVVPQLEFGAETSQLRVTAPKLWGYLEANAEILDGRKSSIYRSRPRFSVFGLGRYTFATYKVAISGLHKQPIFRLIPPLNKQPVLLDDTCYLLPFEDGTEAAVVAALLNSQECKRLIESLVFWDSKRPITKKLLSRIDLNKLPVDAEIIVSEAQEMADTLGIPFDKERALTMIGQLGQLDNRSDTLF